jgi:serine phosphatase RsbU (regulator of sigma subunit)
MHLMILENRRLRTTLRAASGRIVIGSNPQCGVHLPDPRISERLASLSQDDAGSWWLEIEDTSTPTCLNRAVQKGRARLRHADEITVAQFSIRLMMESDKSREELQRERLLAITRSHGETLQLGTIVHRFDTPVPVAREHLEQMTLLVLRLSQVESVRDLLVPVLRAVLRTFDGRRAWIGIRPTDRSPLEWTLGLNDQGQPCERPPSSSRMELRCLAHSQYLCSPESSTPGLRSAMGVPLVCQSGTLGMLYVENNPSDPAYDEASLHAFSTMACCVARPLENILQQAAAKRRAAMSTELALARATQDALTPRAVPQWDDLHLAAYRYMGDSRCQDLYDFVQLPDKTAFLVVARLAVDGPAVPRLLSGVHSAFRSAALHADAPHLFARALNWVLAGGDPRPLVHLATLCLAPATGRVSYCLAGDGVHLRRINRSGGAAVEAPAAPPIGAARSPAYDLQTADLAPGESLCVATSGVDAALNAQGRPFGLASLEECLSDGVGQPPGNVLAEFEADLAEFLSGGSCAEDITVVLGRWR